MVTLKDHLDDIKEIGEINTEDLLESKLFSHDIADTLDIIVQKLIEIESRLTKLEDQELKKGFHQLSFDIEKVIRKHSINYQKINHKSQ